MNTELVSKSHLLEVMALFSWQGMALSQGLEFAVHESPNLEQTGLPGLSLGKSGGWMLDVGLGGFRGRSHLGSQTLQDPQESRPS